jgi:hypothetical protein
MKSSLVAAPEEKGNSRIKIARADRVSVILFRFCFTLFFLSVCEWPLPVPEAWARACGSYRVRGKSRNSRTTTFPWVRLQRTSWNGGSDFPPS